MLKKLNPEMTIGFLVATLFWFGVVGWETSYSPTEKQKEECYDAAKKTGFKADECKTFWERTTSDPIALFNLVLAFSTVGLWVATISLYRAGERQIAVARESAEAAKLNAEALISAERAQLFVIVQGNNLFEALRGAMFYRETESMRDSRIPAATLEFTIKNTGRTAAIMQDVSYQIIQADVGTTLWQYSYQDTIVNAVIEGGKETSPSTTCAMESAWTLVDGMAALDGDRPVYFYGFITFRDTFKREYQYFWRYEYRGRRFVLVHEEEHQIET
jgi:hypothetical protein